MSAWAVLVGAIEEADSEFRLSRIPVDVVRAGVADLDARLKALEAKSRGDWVAESEPTPAADPVEATDGDVA